MNMQSILKRILMTRLSFLGQVAFLAAMMIGGLAATSLPAVAAGSTAPGASVIFASAKGKENVTVLDLGQSVTLKKIKLQFANEGNVKVYVVKTTPSGGTDWSTLTGAVNPNALTQSDTETTLSQPATGEYLVIVSDSDLGPLQDLQVAGSSPSSGTSISMNATITQTGSNTFATTTTTTVGTGANATTSTVTVASTTPSSGPNRFGLFGAGASFGAGLGSLGESPISRLGSTSPKSP